MAFIEATFDHLDDLARECEDAYRAAPIGPPGIGTADTPDGYALLQVDLLVGAVIDDLLRRVERARAIAHVLDLALIGDRPRSRRETLREREGAAALELLRRFA